MKAGFPDKLFVTKTAHGGLLANEAEGDLLFAVGATVAIYRLVEVGEIRAAAEVVNRKLVSVASEEQG